MKWTLLFSFLIITSLAACNKKTDKSGDTAVTSSTDLYIASAQSAADEAADSIAESGTSTSYNPLGYEIEPLGTTGTLTRNCTVSGGSASVLITYADTTSATFSKTAVTVGTISAALNTERSGTETRDWYPAACDGTSKFASIDWASTGAASGVTLVAKLDRSVNRTKTVTTKRPNKTPVVREATDNVAISGTRNCTWAAPTLTSGTVSRDKTITSSVTRTRTFTRLDGTSINTVATVTVGTASPLNVTVSRNNATKALITKTINSGTVVVTDSDASLSSCVFAGVKFDFSSSNTNKCVPVAGSITCKKYATAEAANTATALSTVLINFEAATTSGVSVTVGTEAAEDFTDYNTKGCDLETAS